MKVKELVEMLSKLDQEKEIKTVEAGGYEYDEFTNKDIKVLEYDDCKNAGGYYEIEDDGENKDFYILR